MAEVSAVNALRYIVDAAIENLNHFDSNVKVVWFGRSAYLLGIQRALLLHEKSLSYVIDNNPEIWGDAVDGDLIVFPVEQIVNKYKNHAVYLIASQHSISMVSQLHMLGVKSERIIELPYTESNKEAEGSLLLRVGNLTQMPLEEMQSVMMGILKAARAFCDDNGLRYFLAGGTLLGAVRHKGFIPWDDDADIYLPYEDYIRFTTEFPQGGRYEVVNWENNDKFVLCHAILVDNETVMTRFGGYPIKWLQGVSICVIPLTGYPKEKDKFDQKLRINKRLDDKWYLIQNAKVMLNANINDLRRDIYEQKYNLPMCNDFIVGKAHSMFKPMWHVPYSVFEKSVPIEFEGDFFSAPIGYEYYLKTRFGNYMLLPPENERTTGHGITSFWKEKKI